MAAAGCSSTRCLCTHHNHNSRGQSLAPDRCSRSKTPSQTSGSGAGVEHSTRPVGRGLVVHVGVPASARDGQQQDPCCPQTVSGSAATSREIPHGRRHGSSFRVRVCGDSSACAHAQGLDVLKLSNCAVTTLHACTRTRSCALCDPVSIHPSLAFGRTHALDSTIPGLSCPLTTKH